MKKIFVAFDASPCSHTALATALSLAKAEAASVTICTIVDPIDVAGKEAPAVPNDAALDNARTQARASVDAAVARGRADGVLCEGIVGEGDPAYEIAQRAGSIGADFIVMGTHGRRGLPRLLLGSVAETVLRSAHVPVIVVHA